MRSRPTARWLAAGVAVLLAAPTADAQYTFTQITLPGGATGINNHGQIVGFYRATNDDLVGFLYSNGTYTSFEGPQGTYTYPDGINDAGQVVGFYRIYDASPIDFLYDGGVFTIVDVPVPGPPANAGYKYLTDINNAGQMVGYHSIPLVSGFLYDRGAYSALGFYPTGINDLGQIVGYVPNLPSSSFAHGVFDDHGVLTPLNVPGAVSTYVTGINNAGQIVGSYSTDELLRAYHGFLYSGGVFTTIEVPGASSGGVVGITDAGQLLLSASFASGGGGHFLATPSAVTAAPEPAAWALVGAGLLAIGGVVRRRPSA